MFTRSQAQRDSAEDGLRNIVIVENAILLTYRRQPMPERGILNALA